MLATITRQPLLPIILTGPCKGATTGPKSAAKQQSSGASSWLFPRPWTERSAPSTPALSASSPTSTIFTLSDLHRVTSALAVSQLGKRQRLETPTDEVTFSSEKDGDTGLSLVSESVSHGVSWRRQYKQQRMTSPVLQNLRTSSATSPHQQQQRHDDDDHDEVHDIGDRRESIVSHHSSPIAVVAAESRASPSSSNTAYTVGTDIRAAAAPGHTASVASSPSFSAGQNSLRPSNSGEKYHQRFNTTPDPRHQTYAAGLQGHYYPAPWGSGYPYPHPAYFSAYYNPTVAASSPALPYPAAQSPHPASYAGYPTASPYPLPYSFTPVQRPAPTNTASTAPSSGNLRQGVLPFARHSVSSVQAPSQTVHPASHGRLPSLSSLHLPAESAPHHRHSLSNESFQAYNTYAAATPTLPVENPQSIAYYEQPACTWLEFLTQWRIHVTTAEQDLAAKAKLGHVSDYTPVKMATEYPSFADCESLIAGLKNAGSRVTAERLKQLIRGLNSNSGVTNIVGHSRVTGNKAELQKRVSDALQLLKARQSDEYYAIAKLIGEAQGITYSSPATGHASIPVPAPTVASASPYSTNASLPSPTFPSSSTAGYASRPSEFGLNRNTHANGYSAASSSSQASTSARPYQPPASQAARNTQYPQYSTAPRHSVRPPPIMPPASRYSSMNALPSPYPSSVNHLNSSIPTTWPTAAPHKTSTLAGQSPIPINFKPSPFYKLVAGVSLVTQVAKALPGDKMTATTFIILNEDQRLKLLTSRNDPAATQYQLRLYCTSADFYTPPNTFGSHHIQKPPALMEFPAVSEAKVNGEAVGGSMKGIKKKPGTAPPAPLSETKEKTTDKWALNLTPGAANKVDMNYINTDKLHYMIVYLVEASSINQLVEKIKREKFRTKEDTIKRIRRQNEDPDVMATSQSVSMRDPLAFRVMDTPIRSVHCPHLQCFDAAIFLSMMESTPTWACPVCNRAMQPDDLVHDGFSQDILKALPKDTYDHVIVETDGTWHTEDNKYGTSPSVAAAKEAAATAKANGLPSAGVKAPETAANGFFSKDHSEAGTPMDLKPDMSRTTSGNGRTRTPAVAEVIDLDNEESDDDAPRIPGAASYRQPMASSMNGVRASQGSRATSTPGGAVIDLTLDSDDDIPLAAGRANSLELGPPGAATTIPSSASTVTGSKRRAPAQWEDENPSTQRPRYE